MPTQKTIVSFDTMVFCIPALLQRKPLEQTLQRLFLRMAVSGAPLASLVKRLHRARADTLRNGADVALRADQTAVLLLCLCKKPGVDHQLRAQRGARKF